MTNLENQTPILAKIFKTPTILFQNSTQLGIVSIKILRVKMQSLDTKIPKIIIWINTTISKFKMAELLNLLPLKELLKLETDLRKLEPQGRLLEELPVE